ncbi:MAG: glycosyltransferase family 4 protein [Euryarchaeota archaeon]|nr:glycosyltransferase family 4 protein [Euryarchaeota archaeon]
MSFEYNCNLIGGAGVYALELSRWLERYCALNVYTCAAYDSPPDAFAAAWFDKGASNVHYQRLPYLLRRHGVIAFYYYALFRGNPRGSDVFLVNDLSQGVAPQPDVPVVQIVHHLPSSERSHSPSSTKARIAFTLLAALENRALGRAHTIICDSIDTMQKLHFHYPEHATKTTVIPIGVDVQLFKPRNGNHNDAKAQQPPLILCVARGLETRKGISYLLEAFAAAQRVERAELTVVGTDSQGLKQQLLEQTRALGVLNAVTFINSVPLHELIALYQRATLTVVPSSLEGFSKPALESMACGTPVVGSAVGAIPELIDERSGVVVPPRDTDALADALIRLLRDKERTTAMGAAARQRVLTRFSWDIVTPRVLDVCRQALSR